MDNLVVVVAGLLVGYWFVSALLQRFWTDKPSDQERPRESKGQPPPHSESGPPRMWHEVLGLSPGATSAEVREAYRRLIIQYHPDKVASLGPELQRLAEDKSREITSAYNQAMQFRR